MLVIGVGLWAGQVEHADEFAAVNQRGCQFRAHVGGAEDFVGGRADVFDDGVEGGCCPADHAGTHGQPQVFQGFGVGRCVPGPGGHPQHVGRFFGGNQEEHTFVGAQGVDAFHYVADGFFYGKRRRGGGGDLVQGLVFGKVLLGFLEQAGVDDGNG